jgi:hypothetical protein
MAQTRRSDPFDIPASLIPPGLSYQWVDPEAPQYAAMAKTGWQPVPFERHASFFERRYNRNGFIKVGGQVLVSRLKETTTEARGMEMDKAFANVRRLGGGKQNQRVRAVEVPIHILLTDAQADAALAAGLSAESYASKWIDCMLSGRPPEAADVVVLRPVRDEGAFMFEKPQRTRKPRRWLGWLFNLCSKE